ncbi:MAG TPA: helix-turn-helix domain-containing protein [Candidatus Paceibacterota bacterium]
MNDVRKGERIFKGVAHKYRLQILDLLKRKPELSIIEISEALTIGLKNVSQHIAKMEIAGLLMKRHDGNFVKLKLTARGSSILQFYRIVE